MHPMELVSDVGHVESHFSVFGKVLVLVQERSMVCTEHTIGIEIDLDALGSVRLEIVLLLMQDWCMVCVEHTVGSEIVLEAPARTPR
jgi:hypothetical protein